MAATYQCWQCGATLTDLILPMSRREECGQCGADQHVCKLCTQYSPRGCDEERAERVSDPEKANFCDYFAPNSEAYKGGYLDKSSDAKAKLAALFGDEPEAAETESQALTPAQLAEKKLQDLLNKS